MSKVTENTINLLLGEAYRYNQPHEQFDWLRANKPIYKHSLPDDNFFWAVTRYSDIFEINKNYKKFSSNCLVTFNNHGCPIDHSAFEEYQKKHQEENPEETPTTEATKESKEEESTEEEFEHKPMMIMMDPPHHTGYRKLVSKDLAPANMKHWEGRVQDLTTSIIDDVINNGSCEFVSEVSGRIAGEVIAELMGLPKEDATRLYEFTELFHAMPGTLSIDHIMENGKELNIYLEDIIKRKRGSTDKDLSCDFLNGLVHGEAMTDLDFLQQFMLMVNGGTDTARNIISIALYELLQQPELMTWLKEDLDTRIPLAREEFLRWASPIIYQCRAAQEDMELHGQQIKQGDILAMYYGAANHDPEKFNDPHKIDFTRTANKHLAFGGGNHICVGQWIARIEIDIMLREVLTRMKDITLASEPEWLESNFLFGLKHLHIKFNAATDADTSKAGSREAASEDYDVSLP